MGEECKNPVQHALPLSYNNFPPFLLQRVYKHSRWRAQICDGRICLSETWRLGRGMHVLGILCCHLIFSSSCKTRVEWRTCYWRDAVRFCRLLSLSFTFRLRALYVTNIVGLARSSGSSVSYDLHRLDSDKMQPVSFHAPITEVSILRL